MPFLGGIDYASLGDQTFPARLSPKRGDLHLEV
jgi:hypothetical protein